MLEVKEVRFSGINITRDGIQKIVIQEPPKPTIQENPQVQEPVIVQAEDIKPDWLDERIEKKLKKEKIAMAEIPKKQHQPASPIKPEQDIDQALIICEAQP